MADGRRVKSLGVFYAHPAADSPREIEADRKDLEEYLREQFHKKLGAHASPAIGVTSGRKEHKLTWAGDWEKWQKQIVVRKHATTGDIRYRMFVVPGETCGRATAAILSLALDAGRKVVLWDKDEKKLHRVKEVQPSDPDDWTSGFRVITS